MENFDFSTEETKEFIWDKLNEGVISVLFTKKDGTERLMKCTLHEAVSYTHLTLPTKRIV